MEIVGGENNETGLSHLQGSTLKRLHAKFAKTANAQTAELRPNHVRPLAQNGSSLTFRAQLAVLRRLQNDRPVSEKLRNLAFPSDQSFQKLQGAIPIGIPQPQPVTINWAVNNQKDVAGPSNERQMQGGVVQSTSETPPDEALRPGQHATNSGTCYQCKVHLASTHPLENGNCSLATLSADGMQPPSSPAGCSSHLGQNGALSPATGAPEKANQLQKTTSTINAAGDTAEKLGDATVAVLAADGRSDDKCATTGAVKNGMSWADGTQSSGECGSVGGNSKQDGALNGGVADMDIDKDPHGDAEGGGPTAEELVPCPAIDISCAEVASPLDTEDFNGLDSLFPLYPAKLRQVKEQLKFARMKRRVQRLRSLPEGLPADLRLAALLEEKCLKVLPVQLKLRKAVAMEKWAWNETQGMCLLEFSRWRRCTPQEISEDADSLKCPAWTPTGPLLTKESQTRVLELPISICRGRIQEEIIRKREAERMAEQRRRVQIQELRAAEEAALRKHNLRMQQLEVDIKQGAINARKQFSYDIMNHQREFSKNTRETQAAKRRAQRNNLMRSWHSKEQRRAVREEQERIKALKENDYAEYLRLARHTKDKRLRLLLDKTDEIISQLGVKVKDQRAEALDPDAEVEAVAESMEEAEAEGEDEKIRSQFRYYEIVHRVKEHVEQPAMLQGGQLRHYQLGGLKFLLSLYNNNMNGILADEMGLGKTIQTISLLAYLMEKKGNCGPHLILAPKAVLPNWCNEFRKWVPEMVYIMYDGPVDERKALRERIVDGRFCVLLTHYDLVLKDKSALKKTNWEMVIVDEGHRLKNATSKLAEQLRMYNTKYRILLTGTPIQNSLTELWALLNFVLPKVFQSSETFDDWFAAPFRGLQGGSKAGDKEGEEQLLNEEEQLLVITRLHQVLRPFMLRRTKREVETELPGKTEHVIRCDLSAWQRTWYRQITEEGWMGTGEKARRGLQNTAMHLRKVCNHPFLFTTGVHINMDDAYHDELIRASGKIELLDRILPKLKATGHRVLLFSQMTRALDVIQDFLAFRNFSFLRLDGTTKTEDRARMLEAFNEENSPYFIFLLSTRAGGLGLNLQSADTVIMFDSDWNPQMDLQAEDRAHRIGQKRDVLVLVLVSAGTIEQAIQDRAQQKRDIDAKVIQAGMFNDTATHDERQHLLQSLIAKGATDIGEGVHSEEEVNVMLARTPEEFEIFQKMDEEMSAKRGDRSRLMAMEEVPSYVLEKPAQQGEEVESEAEAAVSATGRRKRKALPKGSYIDGSYYGVMWSDEDSDDDEPAPQKTSHKRKREVAKQTGTEGANERETPGPKRRKGPGRPPKVPPTGSSSLPPRSNTPDLDAASVAGQSEAGDGGPDPDRVSKDKDEDKVKVKEATAGKPAKQTEAAGQEKEGQGPEGKGDAVEEDGVDNAEKQDKDDDHGARSKLRPRPNQGGGGKPPPRKVPRTRNSKGAK